MAMLAEPRQRKRYNLVPRGKALYEDDSRFGTKMLEKMGWSKGKGLGPKENGSQDFVRVRYKNDIQGLGFEQRDDQWTQHESSFSGLLKSLNGEKSDDGENGTRQSAESEDDTPRVGFGFQNDDKQQFTKKDKKAKLKEGISGVSLEEKSKQSKARVHYKKFTRGKDLSQYSEKDLANIFGKKAVDEQEDATTDLYKELNKNHNQNDEKEKDISLNFGGVETISTGLSVSDYFKMKMAALKNRTTKTNQDSEENVSNTANTEENVLFEPLKKKKKKKRDRSIECKESSEEKHTEGQRNNSADDVVIISDLKQQKKKKRSKEIDLATVVNEELDVSSKITEMTSDSHKKKKKKKVVDIDVESEECLQRSASDAKTNPISDTIESEFNEVATIKNHKIKKNKSSDQNIADVPAANQIVDEGSNLGNADDKPKKKSGKRSLHSNEDDLTNSDVPKKTKRHAVSGPIVLTDNDNVKVLHLQDLQDKLNLYNVYRLSSFCAEKFRNLNLSHFPKSSLSQIEGYGLNKDIQLKIETIKTDEMRITKLWDNTLSKYALVEKETKKTYQKYVNETFKARKQKQKRPSLHFKTWKRKNAFAII